MDWIVCCLGGSGAHSRSPAGDAVRRAAYQQPGHDGAHWGWGEAREWRRRRRGLLWIFQGTALQLIVSYSASHDNLEDRQWFMGGWVCLSAPNNNPALLLCGLPWCSSLQVWMWVCLTEYLAFVLVYTISCETMFFLIRLNHTLFIRHFFFFW